MNASQRKPAKFARKVLPTAIALVFGHAAYAAGPINPGANTATQPLPTNGVTAASVSVAATGSVSGTTLAVNLNNPAGGRSVIDWGTFNVGAGYTLSFSGGTAVLNRVGAGNVPGAAPGSSVPNSSNIGGILDAPGMLVALMNPNGIVFMTGAQVNVGSLIATTGKIDEDNFLNHNKAVITYPVDYSREGKRAEITVEAGAYITAEQKGLVALVAPSVVNKGVITATGGTVVLAGADAATVTATITLNGLYEFDVTTGGGVVTNAAGGNLSGATILLTTSAAAAVLSGTINLDGIQRATNAIVVNGNEVALTSDLYVDAGGTVSGNSNTIKVNNAGRAGNEAQIGDAVSIAKSSGAVIAVEGGNYAEQVTLNKTNMRVSGAGGATLSVGANQTGFSIAASGVTLEGMKIVGPYAANYKLVDWDNVPTTNAAVSVAGNNATVRDNDISNIRTGITVSPTATGASITGNKIDNTKGSILIRSNDTAISNNRRGTNGSEWDIVFMSNIADGRYFSPHANLAQYSADMMAMSAANGGAVVNGVITTDGMRILDRRYTSSNRSHVNVKAGANFTAANDFGLGNGLGNPRQPLSSIAAGIDAVVRGGYVDVAGGTYLQTQTLNVDKSVHVRGSGQSGTNATIIDARGVTNYGMLVTADDVSLSNFTLWGPTADASASYGIKVQPPNCSPTPCSTASQRLHDFHISYVTSQGAGRAELDLNGVIGATIDHFTADGMSVSTGSWTKGAGIQITDSKDVTITNSTTDHNLWGGVALYQANRFYDQQMTGITIDVTPASGNHFNEKNPLYLQDESATKNFDFGTIHLAGFDYAVRNPTTITTPTGTADQSQYLWMQKTAQDAFNYAVGAHDKPDVGPESVGVQNTYASYVQGWTGTALTQDFYVGVGTASPGVTQAMKIQAAIDVANMGAMINVFPGSYTESVTTRTSQGVQVDAAGLFVDKDGLTLRGVDSDGHVITSADNVQAWITAGARSNFGMAHGVVANDVTFEGLGFKPKTDYLNKTVEISGNNFTFANSVVDNRAQDGTTQTGGAGALYFGELDKAGHQITRLTVTGSKFFDGSITITEGVGASADGLTFQPAADRVISNNVFIGSSNYRFGGVLLTGYMEEINWRTTPIGAVTLTGNRFSGFDDSVLVRGDQQGVDLRQVMRDNTFDRSVLVTDAGGNVRGEEYASTMGGPDDPIRMRDKYSIQSSIQAGIARSAAGDTVNVGPEATAESVVLNSARNLSFNGSTIGSLTINAADAGIGGRVTASGSGGFLLNAPVSLLADTSLATTGANITFTGDIQTVGGAPYALSLNAGGGDVSMVSGGTQGNPLGYFNVLADDFNLASTLWVSGYDISATGNVSLADHTLNSVGALLSLISAGGNVTGSTTSQGSVQIAGGGDVNTNIISLGNVAIVATNVGGNITGGFILIGAENNVNANVNAVQVVEITSGGTVNVSGSAQSLVLNAASANANGNFGEVVNSGGGAVNVNGRPQPTVRVVELPSQKIVPTTVVTAAESEAGPADSTKPTLKPTLKLLTAEANEAQPAGLSNAAERLRRGESVEIDLTPGNN